MNFIFDSCFFGTNNIYIQNNNTFILQDRIPFTDVTEKMKNFFNTKKNQPHNEFSMNHSLNSTCQMREMIANSNLSRCSLDDQ